MKGLTGLILGLLIGDIIGIIISNYECMNLYNWLFDIGITIVFCVLNYIFLEQILGERND